MASRRTWHWRALCSPSSTVQTWPTQPHSRMARPATWRTLSAPVEWGTLSKYRLRRLRPCCGSPISLEPRCSGSDQGEDKSTAAVLSCRALLLGRQCPPSHIQRNSLHSGARPFPLFFSDFSEAVAAASRCAGQPARLPVAVEQLHCVLKAEEAGGVCRHRTGHGRTEPPVQRQDALARDELTSHVHPPSVPSRLGVLEPRLDHVGGDGHHPVGNPGHPACSQDGACTHGPGRGRQGLFQKLVHAIISHRAGNISPQSENSPFVQPSKAIVLDDAPQDVPGRCVLPRLGRLCNHLHPISWHHQGRPGKGREATADHDAKG
mmetsp:Transcript_12732/g.32601  ORF Transcript_12732/g.32601 Transcript_12732/m.32601 type:complete len:320 (+) Transcript_12732:1661-2620(+)